MVRRGEGLAFEWGVEGGGEVKGEERLRHTASRNGSISCHKEMRVERAIGDMAKTRASI